MNRFRGQTLLAWFGLFLYFFLGLGSAEATVLCFDVHHVKMETSNHIAHVGRASLDSRCLDIDSHCGDCIDIPIFAGASEDLAINATQVSAQAGNVDFSLLSFSESSFDRTTTPRFLSKLSAKKNATLVSLGSIILLI